MKKSRARVESLFTGLERAGLATLVVLLFVFGIACMATPQVDADWRDVSLMARIYAYWQQFAGIYADMLESLVVFMWFGVVVWLWIDTFLRLRRRPLAVTRNIACFAGLLLLAILLRAPADLCFLVDRIRSRGSFYGHAYFEAIADLEVRFLCFAIFGILVVFIGELSQLARRRILQAEWVVGQSAPEIERLKWRRREALILTARGPQLPYFSVIVRLLALVAAPMVTTWGIIKMADEVIDFGFGRLPAPLITKTGSAATGPQWLAGKIRIDSEGRIFLNSDLAVHPYDSDCRRLVSWLRPHETGPKRAFLLQVHPEVRLLRVIEVMSAANRAGVLLVEEE